MFAAWSETIAENLDSPTFFKTSSIFSAIYSPVCDSLDKFIKECTYSFLLAVIIINTYKD
jgi:hypothetical protein